VGEIARNLVKDFHDGLLHTSGKNLFTAQVLTQSLQDFIETLTGWMQRQYLFDPVAVELPFGQDDGSPAWSIDVGGHHRIEIHGRIDRIDLYREPETEETLCVVIDYKSSQKELDPVLMAHGIQLQLMTYLNVLRHWPNPIPLFGAQRLRPAGVFYVSLRGHYPRESNRSEALEQSERARRSAYRHNGRFDNRALLQLDALAGQHEPDQFNYRLTATGRINRACREALDSGQFLALLDKVETSLKAMGQQIYSGSAAVSPYRRGGATACDQCDYRAICRIDPWTHRFRVLKRDEPIRSGS
jgi:ATP-dependent helicase/nuclease subunit B